MLSYLVLSNIVLRFAKNDVIESEDYGFYSTSALLAMQSAVILTAIPPVRPSVRLSVRPSHAGTISKRMKGGSCGLHCEVAKTVIDFLWVIMYHFSPAVIRPRYDEPKSLPVGAVSMSRSLRR